MREPGGPVERETSMHFRSSKSFRALAVFILAAFAAFVLPTGLAATSPRPAADSASLSGFIYAKDMKTTVAGAVVKIRNVANAKEMSSLPTDANGIYTISGVPEGRYLLGVTSGKDDFNLDYALYVKAGELGKLSVALVAGGGQEAGTARTAAKKKGFFSSVAGRILVISAIGIGLYFLIVEPESSPIR